MRGNWYGDREKTPPHFAEALAALRSDDRETVVTWCAARVTIDSRVRGRVRAWRRRTLTPVIRSRTAPLDELVVATRWRSAVTGGGPLFARERNEESPSERRYTPARCTRSCSRPPPGRSVRSRAGPGDDSKRKSRITCCVDRTIARDSSAAKRLGDSSPGGRISHKSRNQTRAKPMTVCSPDVEGRVHGRVGSWPGAHLAWGMLANSR